jgi:hypothetical protein
VRRCSLVGIYVTVNYYQTAVFSLFQARRHQLYHVSCNDKRLLNYTATHAYKMLKHYKFISEYTVSHNKFIVDYATSFQEFVPDYTYQTLKVFTVLYIVSSWTKSNRLQTSYTIKRLSSLPPLRERQIRLLCVTVQRRRQSMVIVSLQIVLESSVSVRCDRLRPCLYGPRQLTLLENCKL